MCCCALYFTPASYLEQVDDERAAVAQVVNDLKVVDVAVHGVRQLDTKTQRRRRRYHNRVGSTSLL